MDGRSAASPSYVSVPAAPSVTYAASRADSPDHDPPREDLIRAGVPDPDALVYLWPSHWICNVRRGRRPITPELLATLRRQYLADQTRAAAALALSPRFKRRFSP